MRYADNYQSFLKWSTVNFQNRQEVQEALTGGMILVNEVIPLGPNGHNMSNVNFITINHAISQKAPIEVLKLLLENGAVPFNNTTTSGENAPVHNTINYAISQQAPIEIIELLFANGAKCLNDDVITSSVEPGLKARDTVCNTLNIALQEGASMEIVKLLLDNGARPNNSEMISDELFFNIFFMGYKDDLSAQSKIDNTLQIALRNNVPIGIIGLLLDNGALPNNSDQVEYNSLSLALNHPDSEEVVAKLILNGADLQHLPDDNPKKAELVELIDRLNKKQISEMATTLQTLTNDDNTSIDNDGQPHISKNLNTMPTDMLNEIATYTGIGGMKVQETQEGKHESNVRNMKAARYGSDRVFIVTDGNVKPHKSVRKSTSAQLMDAVGKQQRETTI